MKNNRRFLDLATSDLDDTILRRSSNKFFGDILERAQEDKQLKDEIQDLRIEIDFDNEYQKKDQKDKINNLWKKTAKIQFDSTHSAFESQTRDIEEWKNKALEDLGEFKDAVGDKSLWIQFRACLAAY